MRMPVPNVFDDVLQNAKHRANDVNRPPLGLPDELEQKQKLF